MNKIENLKTIHEIKAIKNWVGGSDDYQISVVRNPLEVGFLAKIETSLSPVLYQ